MFLTAASAWCNEPLQKLITEAQAAGDHQAEAYARIVQREVELAQQSYNSGDVQTTKTALDDVITYADKSLDAARMRRKHLKEAELKLRGSARRLEDLERSMTFEDRPPARAAREHVQQIDSEVLQLMFAPAHK